MSNILVRDLDNKTINRLKVIAKKHGRSLQGEIKAILTEATSLLMSEAAAISGQWQKSLSKKSFSDSSILIREDRNR